jgi:hypothetical protein
MLPMDLQDANCLRREEVPRLPRAVCQGVADCAKWSREALLQDVCPPRAHATLPKRLLSR